MEKYHKLAEKIVFKLDDALAIYKNKSTTYASLKRLEKQGMIKRVRNNLYVIINPITKTAFANKYQIGSSITEDAYITQISALEYYGYQNQVSNFCYVSSISRFNSFEFEGVTYKQVSNKIEKGVMRPPYTQLIKISDIEKTVIDAMHKIDAIINLEELIYSFELIPSLDEKKIIEYLKAYNIQALYQKAGYLLSLVKEKNNFSESLFLEIQNKIDKGISYLSEEAKRNGVYIKEYQIVVPKWLVERN